MKPKNRAWIAIFLFLIVASVGVAVFMIYYNLSLQLTVEQLKTAREVWREKGLVNYQMTYVKMIEGQATQKFAVKVRKGDVTEVLMNGMPLDTENRPYHSMDRLFSDVAEFLKIDQKPDQPKAYNRAEFDTKYGAMRVYIRRVMGTRQRLELRVTEFDDLK